MYIHTHTSYEIFIIYYYMEKAKPTAARLSVLSNQKQESKFEERRSPSLWVAELYSRPRTKVTTGVPHPTQRSPHRCHTEKRT